jgi:hypothetical protein
LTSVTVGNQRKTQGHAEDQRPSLSAAAVPPASALAGHGARYVAVKMVEVVGDVLVVE